MKKHGIILLFAVCSFSTVVNAQVKIWSNGGISIGSESDPGANIISLDKETVFPGDIYDTPYFSDGLKTYSIETQTSGLSIEGDYGDIKFSSGPYSYMNITTDKSYYLFDEGIKIDNEVYLYSTGTGSFKMQSYFGYVTISTSPTPYVDFTTGSGNFRFNKPLWYNSSMLYSDIRLKENIKKIKDNGSALAKISRLEGIEYNFKEDSAKVKKVGFSAQEVQIVFPELVGEDENEILAVDYIGIIPYLLEAIKEQEARIIKLEKMIKDKDLTQY